MAARALRVDVDELEPLRDDPAVAGGVGATVDDGVLEVDQHSGRVARVGVVDKNGALAEQCVVALDNQADGAVEQWVAGRNVVCERSALDGDQALLEGDPFIAPKKRCAEADLTIAPPKLGGYMSDLEAARLAVTNRTTEQGERLEEERTDEVRLELARLGPLHVIPDPLDVGGCHYVADQRPLMNDCLGGRRRPWRRRPPSVGPWSTAVRRIGPPR